MRIRILEQEAERHLRRVHSLEQQLTDMERKTQERVEQVPVHNHYSLFILFITGTGGIFVENLVMTLGHLFGVSFVHHL